MARRTKEDAQKTRELLIEAAENVFYDKGVSKASLSDIAESAGVTRGAIYWHFKNKHDVFEAMIERLIELDYPHPVRLFWGARVEEDLYLPDLPAQWRRQLADFHAVTALSDTFHTEHRWQLAELQSAGKVMFPAQL